MKNDCVYLSNDKYYLIDIWDAQETVILRSQVSDVVISIEIFEEIIYSVKKFRRCHINNYQESH